jgi:uncharacterized protein YbjT (DUF2867 family)
MRSVTIGATGHIGTYLIPRLVEAGDEVVVVNRGQRKPYQPLLPGARFNSSSSIAAPRRPRV